MRVEGEQDPGPPTTGFAQQAAADVVRLPGCGFHVSPAPVIGCFHESESTKTERRHGSQSFPIGKLAIMNENCWGASQIFRDPVPDS